jgi:hypothetical protein
MKIKINRSESEPTRARKKTLQSLFIYVCIIMFLIILWVSSPGTSRPSFPRATSVPRLVSPNRQPRITSLFIFLFPFYSCCIAVSIRLSQKLAHHALPLSPIPSLISSLFLAFFLVEYSIRVPTALNHHRLISS